MCFPVLCLSASEYQEGTRTVSISWKIPLLLSRSLNTTFGFVIDVYSILKTNNEHVNMHNTYFRQSSLSELSMHQAHCTSEYVMVRMSPVSVVRLRGCVRSSGRRARQGHYVVPQDFGVFRTSPLYNVLQLNKSSDNNKTCYHITISSDYSWYSLRDNNGWITVKPVENTSRLYFSLYSDSDSWIIFSY